MTSPAQEMKGHASRSVRFLEWSNFFIADVQTGLGPFLAAYLSSAGWPADRVGYALTIAGIVSVIIQTPAGAFIDSFYRKRLILVGASSLLCAGAITLALSVKTVNVFLAQALIGSAGAFVAPTLAAITMGLVGSRRFDRQFGRNQGFNSAGNLAAAAAIAIASRLFNNSAIFWLAALLTVPTILCVLSIREDEIDHDLARGGCSTADGQPDTHCASGILDTLLRDRVLLSFIACAFLFHLANAAMLPQVGEMLAQDSPRSAAPFMAACVAATQLVIMCSAAWIGRSANRIGRRKLLILGFGVLPVRAFLYTVLTAKLALIGVQLLDGVANAIFGVVSVLVISDRTRGSGRFNLAQGALATAVGLGAALSNSFGGKLIAISGFRASFLTLGATALLATLLLLIAVPETKPQRSAGTGS